MARNDLSRTLALLMLAVLAPAAGVAPRAAAQTWRCVDPRGAVLYTDIPCAGGSIVAAPPAEAAGAARAAGAESSSGAAPQASHAVPAKARGGWADAERYGWSPGATLVPWPPRPLPDAKASRPGAR